MSYKFHSKMRPKYLSVVVYNLVMSLMDVLLCILPSQAMCDLKIFK